MYGFKTTAMDSPHNTIGEWIGGVVGSSAGCIHLMQISTPIMSNIPAWIKWTEGAGTALAYGGFGVLGAHIVKWGIRKFKAVFLTDKNIKQ